MGTCSCQIGVDIPMLVILLGALGGIMFSGIIEFFTSAVVFTIMYTLFMSWIAGNENLLNKRWKLKSSM
ncbi:MAG: hypothetical protein ACI8PB_004867 [Desulforhopalus sp.]